MRLPWQKREPGPEPEPVRIPEWQRAAYRQAWDSTRAALAAIVGPDDAARAEPHQPPGMLELDGVRFNVRGGCLMMLARDYSGYPWIPIQSAADIARALPRAIRANGKYE